MRMISPHSSIVALACLVLLLIGAPRDARGDPPSWNFQGNVADGLQFDVVRGPADVFHLVSTRYYQFDDQGAQMVVENQGDGMQGALDFAPAIAVGDDGTAHLVTRHGGDIVNGHDIRYRRRTAAGVWDLDYIFATPVRRNYGVGVAWSGGHVYLANTDNSADPNGIVHLFEEMGGSASPLGNLPGIWRFDASIRMRGAGGRVHLAGAMPYPDAGGRVYYLAGNAGATLFSDLVASQVLHDDGPGRTGGPDLHVDGNGAVHFSYGPEYAIYYNQYSATGQKVLTDDVQVMSGLGYWALKWGLSTVASSDSGSIVVVVALSSNSVVQDNLAEDCSLVWSYSVDGGQTFSAPLDMGHTSNGGYGRLRPRLTATGQKFFLFYKDNDQPGISLATLEFESTGFSDFLPSGEIVDDTPDCSVRVRNEFTGLDVSSAQCEYTTNGGADWTPWAATCTGADGTNALETISAADVPFLQESTTQNQIRFRVTSMGGLVTESEAHTVSIAASVVTPDGGPEEGDAAVVDGGPSPDGGLSSDGGPSPDGGDDPGFGGASGGCSCQHLSADSAKHGPGSGPGLGPGLLILMLVLLGLVCVRRARVGLR